MNKIILKTGKYKIKIFYLLIIPLYSCFSSGLICSYPESLKISIEKNSKKPCQNIQPKELSHITHLKFESIKELSDITVDHFSALTQLESLDLSGYSSIITIPDFVYSLKELKHLDISTTGISDFNSQLCRSLPKLESLIGRNNSYKNNEIPFHTFCLQNLKTLDMSNSRLIYMDEYLYYLQNLERLNVADNQLFSLPFSIQFMNQLKQVDLRNNGFKNENINQLHSCMDENNANNLLDCQEDLLSELNCEWDYEFPHTRGKPFRRYREMTDEEFYAFNTQRGHEAEQEENRTIGNRADICYEYFLEQLKQQGGFNEESGFTSEGFYKGENSLNAHLLNNTINGKTIREWRLAYRLRMDFLTSGGSASFWTEIFRDFFNICRIKRRFILGQYYLANEWEYFPEKNFAGKTFYLGDIAEEQETAFERCKNPVQEAVE